MNSTEINFNLFSKSYSHIHGWLAVFICILGIIFNTFNVIILKKIKLNLHVNNILILIASFNSTTMFFYLPYCLHYYVLNERNTIYSDIGNPNRDTLFWISYEILSTLICLTTHSISIWLTVYLSIYRYLNMLKSISIIRKKSNQIDSIKFVTSNTKTFLVLIVLFCILYCIPSYLYPQANNAQFQNTTLYFYYIAESELNFNTNNLIFKLSFYIQAIVGKILPCSLLGVFIGLIRHNLNIVNLNKENVLCLNNIETTNVIYNNNNEIVVIETNNTIQQAKRIEHKQKTLMLLFVCLLLFIAELPQAFLLLCSIFSDYIYLTIYKPLGDLLDVLVLITYPINFFIYCSMSKLFRNEFFLLFKQKSNDLTN
jgi:hypothetical protein